MLVRGLVGGETFVCEGEEEGAVIEEEEHEEEERGEETEEEEEADDILPLVSSLSSVCYVFLSVSASLAAWHDAVK